VRARGQATDDNETHGQEAREECLHAAGQSSALVPGAAREVALLIKRVVAILEEARSQVVRTVNSTMVLAYW
jgi:hypothetical protein